MIKKRLKLTAVIVVSAIALAGCGNGGLKPQAGSTATPAPASAAAAPQEAKERRIVSTTVAVTQMLDALEVDLVGIPTSVKTMPERYEGVTEVGNPMSPDMEIVKSLNPTDVLSVTTLQYELEPVFENADLNATFLDLTSLDDMKAEITKLGNQFGKQERAADIVGELESKLADIRSRIEGKEPPTVLILLGVPGSYLVATENSYIGDLVKLLGGRNIVQGETVEYLASNTEYLQQANPDVILRAAHGMPEEVVQMFDAEFEKNDIWKHFTAVQTGRVYDLEEALFGTTGNMAAGEALEALLPMLYP